jgi:hypothetical protein
LVIWYENNVIPSSRLAISVASCFDAAVKHKPFVAVESLGNGLSRIERLRTRTLVVVRATSSERMKGKTLLLLIGMYVQSSGAPSSFHS